MCECEAREAGLIKQQKPSKRGQAPHEHRKAAKDLQEFVYEPHSLTSQKLNRNEDRSMGKIRKSLMHLETGVSVVSAHSRKEEWKMMFQ